MLPAEFVTAIHDAGVPRDMPRREQDRMVAAMLKVEESTVRRWYFGMTPIPGPVQVALDLMRQLRTQPPR